mmetsp:Transcript_46383/g.145516  ORF Transcript_46383/g.145516 Transcript_46383/m.145516 type:complete len:216 (-) Transcript_46383:679-1326(-)
MTSSESTRVTSTAPRKTSDVTVPTCGGIRPLERTSAVIVLISSLAALRGQSSDEFLTHTFCPLLNGPFFPDLSPLPWSDRLLFLVSICSKCSSSNLYFIGGSTTLLCRFGDSASSLSLVAGWGEAFLERESSFTSFSCFLSFLYRKKPEREDGVLGSTPSNLSGWDAKRSWRYSNMLCSTNLPTRTHFVIVKEKTCSISMRPMTPRPTRSFWTES